MHAIKKAFFLVVLVTVAAAQSPQTPLDSRLPVHTLVREDIFAGFMIDNMERFERGEKNIQLLLEQRPMEKAGLLAWKGGAALYRAVRAYEDNRTDEFERLYRQAVDLFSQAGTTDAGAVAVTGGSYLVFADRLPKEYRAAAWSQAYDNYKLLWKYQGSVVDRLPVHLRGELLGGLAQSSQRTGHTEETSQYVDKILAVLGGTPYEPIAKKWKSNPEAAANTSITCMSCHDAGRLAARTAAFQK
ncbi:MAG: hypothetical protein AABN33_29625 [Acidobacteriota bacterium]